MKKLLMTAAAVLALSASAANADTVLSITFANGANTPTFGPQSTSSPCVIAATNCSQPTGFGFNEFSPNSGASFDRYSTNVTGNVADGVQGVPYTVGQLAGVVGTAFNIILDVNTTAAASESILLLEVLDLTLGTRIAHYDGPTLLGPFADNNGNGFGDFTFSTVSLAGLSLTDNILFHAQWTNAVDGGESFFLKAVPGPIVGAGIPGLITACFGMVGFNRFRRRRNGQTA
jgi:hypothetical protein